MKRRCWVSVVVAVAVSGLAGCGADSPAPAPPAGNGLPPRPATLKIEGVDPCTLLTPAQYSQLKVDAGRRRDNEPDRALQATGCFWSTDKSRQRVDYSGRLLLNQGAEFALGAEPLRTVGGYAATTTGSAFADPQWYCTMLVDVAPGQSMQVSYGVDTRDIPGTNHVKACDQAQTAAEFMLANLRAAQPVGGR